MVEYGLSQLMMKINKLVAYAIIIPVAFYLYIKDRIRGINENA